MKTIALSDIIFATVIRRGITVAMVKLNGLTSLAQIVARVRASLGEIKGMVTLTLRNSSRGWTDSRAVML